MADLAVGLAKSVVEGTLSMAQAAIAEEAKLRDGAQRDLVFITGEFQMMQSVLKVANTERVENPVVMTWVRQIRELAYDVEDCIEFVVHLDKKPSWWWRMVPSWCLFTPIPLNMAVDEIEQLKARVADVSTRNARYSLISDTGSKPAMFLQLEPEATSRSATALRMLIGGGADPAGRKQQGDLTQLLTRNNDHASDSDLLRVISVWGTGGGDLGVTTTIWKAYDDHEIGKNFTLRAWVKLMHPFSPHDFARCLKDQFYANACPDQDGKVLGLDVLRRRTLSEATQQGGDDRLQELEKQLNTQSYLVVLEDLTTMTDWDTIRKFFPKRNKGSRIIICTQQPEVATLSVGHPYQVMDLNQFSVDHSVYAVYKEGSQPVGDKGKGTNEAFPITLTKKEAAQEWISNHPLTGRESELNDLQMRTTKAYFDSIQVMSVWGIAGVGKSALVRKMFCDIIIKDFSSRQNRRLFDKYSWVDVSHPFSLRDFARSLLLNFQSESIQPKEMAQHGMAGSENPILECQMTLSKMRCLIVIDGLQSTKEWDLIQAQLISGSQNNFIIVITIEASLATHCRGDKTELLFNVKGLEADASFDIFKSKVSATQYPLDPRIYDDKVVDLPKLQELVSKCGGLPKVIAVIASSLGKQSIKQMDYARSLCSKFMHDLEGNREFDSLQGLFGWIRQYFRNCPDSLKPCIFYLSIFPRDYIIRRRRLVRRWIAEGYCRDNHEECAEHNGEMYFSDLLDLSIIIQQPAPIVGNMRMVFFQVNGFIHEYIFARRMEENLVFELGERCALTTQRSGRHLVILKSWDRDRIVFESMDFSRLRSLTVFGSWKSFLISESMKLLRVLDLEDATDIVYEDLENIVKWLCRLKFLSLRKHREVHHLPSSIDHLRQLQTLDIRGTSIVTLPESITRLQKLQYIRAGITNIPESTPPPQPASPSWFCRHQHGKVGVVLPKGIEKLTVLHTLGVVNIAASGAKAMVKELKNLTQMRKLGVSGINSKNNVNFFSTLNGHVHLESLSIQVDKDNQGCLDSIKLPLENLRSLKLYGLNDKFPEWNDQLKKLEKLDLEMVTLMKKNDTEIMKKICLEILGEIPQLCILRVKQLQDRELHFRVMINGEEEKSYKNLKIIEIACGYSSSPLHVTFGSETMEKLELLRFDYSSGSSYRLTGLDYLSGLKQVQLKGTTDEQIKTYIQEQLLNHPNKPAVKLE